jgi:hypothetical protein
MEIWYVYLVEGLLLKKCCFRQFSTKDKCIHPFVVVFLCMTPGQPIKVHWGGGGFSQEVIPASYWSPGSYIWSAHFFIAICIGVNTKRLTNWVWTKDAHLWQLVNCSLQWGIAGGGRGRYLYKKNRMKGWIYQEWTKHVNLFWDTVSKDHFVMGQFKRVLLLLWCSTVE